MKNDFTGWEARYLKLALLSAIYTEETFIDAHRVQWKKRGGGKRIPAEYRSLARQSRRKIKRWIELYDKL